MFENHLKSLDFFRFGRKVNMNTFTPPIPFSPDTNVPFCKDSALQSLNTAKKIENCSKKVSKVMADPTHQPWT